MDKLTQSIDNESFSINQLSKRLHSDRRTLADRLRNVAPAEIVAGVKRYRMADVLAAMEASGKGQSELAKLKAEKLRAEIQRLKFNLAREAQEWIPRAEIVRLLSETLENTKRILRLKIENELPALAVGLDAPAIRTLCEKAIDASLNGVCQFVETLRKDHEARIAKAAAEYK